MEQARDHRNTLKYFSIYQNYKLSGDSVQISNMKVKIIHTFLCLFLKTKNTVSMIFLRLVILYYDRKLKVSLHANLTHIKIYLNIVMLQ